jgi:hypothetical protein
MEDMPNINYFSYSIPLDPIVSRTLHHLQQRISYVFNLPCEVLDQLDDFCLWMYPKHSHLTQPLDLTLNNYCPSASTITLVIHANHIFFWHATSPQVFPFNLPYSHCYLNHPSKPLFYLSLIPMILTLQHPIGYYVWNFGAWDLLAYYPIIPCTRLQLSPTNLS